ncbi:MAG: RagB/SusD family nutrient uptake outer membrane protein [Clostridiales bacterium]|nr:RagB/SusD family nutrient uptake outer membrane protein [Clostridiales bacterium]
MNKYIIASALVALTLSSCNDFLDVQPEGNPTTTTFFTNDQQAIDAVDMLYGRLAQENVFGREVFWEQGAANDVVWAKSRNYATLATFKYTGDESPIRDAYTQFYAQMARANYIVKGLLNKSTLTPVEKRSLGEAFFIRAFCHFWIAHRYGTDELGVPFVRWEDFAGEYDNSIPPQRATVMENYRLIVEDLENAMKYLPKFEEYDADNQGRAHQAAALGYIAKTYAYWATWDQTKWGDVITAVNRLENEFGRGIADTFEEVFSSDFADFWNREYIWSIPSNGGSLMGGVELPGVMLEDKGWGKYNGWGQIKPSNDIYEEMLKDGADNRRLKYSILSYGDDFRFFGEDRKFWSSTNLNVGFQVYKFQHAYAEADCQEKGLVSTNGNWPTVRINFPLLRMAEMVLFRAEAYLMTGKPDLAKTDINKIRKRSGLTELTANATMKDLYHERRCELAFEYSNHLFDLKRWHRSSNSEIKALAAAELNARPTVRFYENRMDPNSNYTVKFYEDYTDKLTYKDDFMTFPYPPQEVTKSNGKLKNLSCWK